ncbi:hypothetical protein EYF80_026241 [Liparis tanakae]|uniref:Uncharacterized protein n=1 Tax=Liparis tanakae TaxID=230148 RepID=A0A4Z2HCN4_9TELE|nr:hypothetical protein EYF80_026241 [Liparis tanakae]
MFDVRRQEEGGWGAEALRKSVKCPPARRWSPDPPAEANSVLTRRHALVLARSPVGRSQSEPISRAQRPHHPSPFEKCYTVLLSRAVSRHRGGPEDNVMQNSSKPVKEHDLRKGVLATLLQDPEV